MSSFATIRRYYLIYEKVSQGRMPSFADIRSHLNDNGFEMSARTLQRDIERLRRDFGIEITYDKETKGYFIDTEESIKPDVFLHFLDIVGTAELLNESLSRSKDTLRFLHFEAGGYFQGNMHIPVLLSALHRSRCISFSHKGFFSDAYKQWCIEPYLLKEYQNRWYVIGIPRGSNAFINFGLDRIKDLKITGPLFKRRKEGPEELLRNTIGLTWNISDVEEVVFSVCKPNDNYVRTLPLHHSQEIIAEDDTSTVFRLYVHLNYELIQKLMTHSYMLTVLKPEKLVQEMKSEFEKSLANYKSKKSERHSTSQG